MASIASFHIIRDHGAFTNLRRLGQDRLTLRRTDGLQFWRLMGTGRGRDTGPSVDLRRRAMFGVWDDETALDQFLSESSVALAWQEAAETWSVRLRLIDGHGAWAGRSILADLHRGGPTVRSGPAPRTEPTVVPCGAICTLTRANVRVRHWPTFAAAARQTSADVAVAPGLLRVAGIGEAPVGRQATFAIWRNADAIRAFAYENPGHIDVMARTRRDGWYGEELFARFEPYASTGSWDGDDPLAAR